LITDYTDLKSDYADRSSASMVPLSNGRGFLLTAHQSSFSQARTDVRNAKSTAFDPALMQP